MFEPVYLRLERAARALTWRGIILRCCGAATLFALFPFAMAAADAIDPVRERTAALVWITGLLASAAFLVWTLIHFARHQRPTPTSMARRIERRIGGFREVLSSATELRQRHGSARNPIECALFAEAASRARELPLRALSLPWYGRTPMVAAVVAGAILLAVLSNVPQASRKALYGLAGWAGWGSPGITLSPHPLQVPVNSDFTVEAAVHRWEPELEILFDQSGAWERHPVVLDEARTGSFTFYDVAGPVRFRLETPSLATPWQILNTYVPPALDSIEIEVEPPAYTGLPTRTLEALTDIETVLGSTLRFTFSSGSAETISLQYGEAAYPLRREEDSSLFRGRLAPESSGEYRVRAQSAEQHSMTTAAYALTLQPDNPPLVDITRPGRDLTLRPDQRLELELFASDDFGIEATHLIVSISGQERIRLRLREAAGGANNRPGLGAEALYRPALNLIEIGAGDGAILSYYTEVTDNREPEGQTTRSEVFFAEVRAEREKIKMGGQEGAEQQEIPIRALIVELKRLVRETHRLRALPEAEALPRMPEVAAGLNALRTEVVRVQDELTAAIERAEARNEDPVESIDPQMLELALEFPDMVSPELRRILRERGLLPPEPDPDLADGDGSSIGGGPDPASDQPEAPDPGALPERDEPDVAETESGDPEQDARPGETASNPPRRDGTPPPNESLPPGEEPPPVSEAESADDGGELSGQPSLADVVMDYLGRARADLEEAEYAFNASDAERALGPQERALGNLVALENLLRQFEIENPPNTEPQQQAEGGGEEGSPPGEEQPRSALEQVEAMLREAEAMLDAQRALNQEAESATRQGSGSQTDPELARRQRDLAERSRRLAGQAALIEPLRRSAQALGEASREMENARDAYGSQGIETAFRRGVRAEEALVEAAVALEDFLGQAAGQMLAEMSRQAAAMGQQQQQQARQSASAAGQGGAQPGEAESMRASQQTLREAYEQLLNGMRSSASELRGRFPEAAEAIGEIARRAEREAIASRQERAENALLYERFQRAERFQQEAANALGGVAADLERARGELPLVSPAQLERMLSQMEQTREALTRLPFGSSQAELQEQLNEILRPMGERLGQAGEALNDRELQELGSSLTAEGSENPAERAEEGAFLLSEGRRRLLDYLRQLEVERELTLRQESGQAPERYRAQVEAYFRRLAREERGMDPDAEENSGPEE